MSRHCRGRHPKVDMPGGIFRAQPWHEGARGSAGAPLARRRRNRAALSWPGAAAEDSTRASDASHHLGSARQVPPAAVPPGGGPVAPCPPGPRTAGCHRRAWQCSAWPSRRWPESWCSRAAVASRCWRWGSSTGVQRGDCRARSAVTGLSSPVTAGLGARPPRGASMSPHPSQDLREDRPVWCPRAGIFTGRGLSGT